MIWALAVAVANATRAIVACMVARRLTETKTFFKIKKLKKVEKQLIKACIMAVIRSSPRDDATTHM